MDETVTGREEDPHERARFFMNLPPVPCRTHVSKLIIDGCGLTALQPRLLQNPGAL